MGNIPNAIVLHWRRWRRWRWEGLPAEDFPPRPAPASAINTLPTVAMATPVVIIYFIPSMRTTTVVIIRARRCGSQAMQFVPGVLSTICIYQSHIFNIIGPFHFGIWCLRALGVVMNNMMVIHINRTCWQINVITHCIELRLPRVGGAAHWFACLVRWQ